MVLCIVFISTKIYLDNSNIKILKSIKINFISNSVIKNVTTTKKELCIKMYF